MKISLCLLTYNELPCLQVILPLIPKPGLESGFDEIVAIDGGSTDGTIELYHSYGIKVIGQSRRGRGNAFQIAFSELDADAFIFFSPDGNEDINDLPKFRKFLEHGADLVIASRMSSNAHNEEDEQFWKWRKWANQVFNVTANLCFRRNGTFVSDSINGYRAIKRDAANILSLDAMDYTIEYQMTIRAFKNRMKIIEFPTNEGQRIAGTSGAPSIVTGLKFLRCLKNELLTSIR